MGLSTYPNPAWRAPYSCFHDFRQSLATQIGINLDEYQGYDDKGTKDLSTIRHDIMPLLNHADNEGLLTRKECRRIARGLKSILLNFNPALPHDPDFIEDATRFMNGCLLAVRKKKRINFH